VLLALASTVASQESRFSTGPPLLIEPKDAAASAGRPLMTQAEYARFVDGFRSVPSFVPLRVFPENLSPNARFGINFVFGGKNHGFVVDGDATRGYLLFADLNGNGNLRDVVPVRFDRRDNYLTALVHVAAPALADAQEGGDEIPVRFIVVPAEGQLKHSLVASTSRSGVATLGDRRVAFRLVGSGGTYDFPTDALWLDTNGDGMGFDPRDAREVFRVRERRVNVDGHGYEFRVDPHGRYLALTALSAPAAERPTLAPGSLAPDFTAVSTDGAQQSLTKYRGKVVLLDFWAIWCGPCREESSVLLSLYQRYQAEGLAMIGISPDKKEDVEKYVAAERHTWSQIVEGDHGPLNNLFRIIGLPTHVLIGRDGRIVWTKEGGMADEADVLDREIKHALDGKQ
jgi:peroxiredoxin